MSTFIKNESSWKMAQLKKLTFEEIKVEFAKLMRSIKSFVPMGSEESVKRPGVQLEQESSKKQKTVGIKEVLVIEESDAEPVVAKEEGIERPVKKRGKRKKQIARKGIHVDKTAQYETEEEREAHMKDKVTDPSSGSDIGIDAIPTATKPPSVVDWKIIPQLGQKAVYQIIRRDGSDKIYMSFGAILKDFSKDDLTELYRLVIKKYGANRPEEMYDRVLWGDLKTMFDPPLSDDAIWSWPLQQKMVNSELQGGTKDEVCYQLLKYDEKQVGLSCKRQWKRHINPLMAGSLPILQRHLSWMLLSSVDEEVDESCNTKAKLWIDFKDQQEIII
ncbi:hypothetical protein Tco_0671952 [Tanacetum coccineum]